MTARNRAPIFAVVTPFDGNDGIDHGAFREYLQWLAGKGASRIVVGGTTGEFASLTLDERRALLQTARSTFRGEVIAHVSTCAIRDTREMIAHARDHADAVLLLPPYYFADATKAGVGNYFARVAADCPLPLYLYNFPRHTQISITPAMLQQAKADLPTLRGIKDSGGKWDQSVALKKAAPELEVIVGSDGAALRVLEEGLDGTVTGGANPVPNLMVNIHARWMARDLKGAKEAQERLNEWTSARKAMGVAEIPLVKAALSKVVEGFQAHVRPPLLPAQPGSVPPSFTSGAHS